MNGSTQSIVRLAVEAMKCRFELILAGDDPGRLRAVGEEALEEIESLGGKLNFYSPSSLLSRLNHDASTSPVKLDARLYELLTLCRDVHHRTDGAFDPTISPLLDAWGFSRRQGRRPSRSELDTALSRVGFEKVLMDDEDRTVRLTQGATLNLSSIAKGYALDCAAEILSEHGIETALLHGGTSSILALGSPPNEQTSNSPATNQRVESAADIGGAGWLVEVADPRENGLPLRWTLQDEAMSVSSNHFNLLRVAGKSRCDFEPEKPRSKNVGHVIDPRSGLPADSILLASVKTDWETSHPAARADAYATAALVDTTGGPAWQNEVKNLHRTTAR